MNQRLAILDYLKQPTGAFCDGDPQTLQWNEFVGYAQCSVFDCSGRILLLRRKHSDSSMYWEGAGSYLYEQADSLTTITSVLSELLGNAFIPANLSYLRALNRHLTIIDLYEYHLPTDAPISKLPKEYSEARFVTEEELKLFIFEGVVRESMHAAFHYREMAAMHYKNIYRSGWPRVTKREYTWEYVRDNLLDGIISLLHIQNVKQKNVKTMIGRDFIITDKDYYWFQYAPSKEHFWLTAMFDPDLNIVQYYFDISYLNEVFWDGNAYFFDLYLDIVLIPGGTQILLDEDELDEAFSSGKITKEMYDLAWEECHKLQARLEGREEELRELVLKLTKHLKRQLERKR